MTTETTTPNCWADGSGIWHATVTLPGHPTGSSIDWDLADARRIARKAMIAELAEREGPGFDPATICARIVERDGMTFHFREASTGEYTAQCARDAAASDYGPESYWDDLNESSRRHADYFAARGDIVTAELMLTQSLSEALRGNDGD